MSGFQAFLLGGPTNGGLRYPTPPQWTGPASFTVSFWMRATPAADVNTWILDLGNRGMYEGVHWALTQAKRQPLQAGFGFWGDGAYQNVFPFTPWVGTWVHVATVFDAAARTLRTYVNGQEQAAGSKTFPANNKIQPRKAGWVTIGPGPAGWQILPGLIDEVRIWDTPVPADQIRARMYRRLSVPQEHLISYVNLPAPFSVDMMAAHAAGRAAVTLGAVLACRDLVTNQKVEELGAVALVPSAVPTGSQARLAGAGEVAIFQAPNYQGHSWLFPEEPQEFDVRWDLSRCDVGSMRVGDHTAARIFAEAYYAGLSQEALSDLPALTATRLAENKKTALSVQVASTRGRPQRGDWAIASSAGPYLSARPEEGGAIPLRRSSGVDDEGLFRVEVLGTREDRQEVSIQSPAHPAYLTAAVDGRLVFRDPQVTERSRWVMTAEPGAGRFSLGTADGRWVASRADAGFELTVDGQRREVFTLAFHAAADESQVGELPVGSVAFYERPSYWGRAWVFPGAQADLRLIKGLSVKSMRLGPETGVTLFDGPAFADTGNAADVVHDTPDLSGSTFKGAAITSFKTWRVVSPGAIGLESATTLSQDYRTVQGKIQAFCAYRASLGLPRNVATVEVGVTERATLEIDGQQRELGAGESWTVPVNPFGRLIVTSEASHLFSAGLKIRTDTMAGDQHIVLFPDEEAHAQLATLEGDALWEGRDHSGNRVLRDGVTRDGAAQVQSAIKAMMAATDYTRTTVDVKEPAGPARDQGALREGAAAWQWTTCARVITQRRMEGEGWILDFDALAGSRAQLASGLKTGAANAPGFRVLSAAQVAQLWDAPTQPLMLGGIGEFFEALWNEGKKIVHVIVRKVATLAEQIAVQIRYIGDVVREFVVSTVTQAAAVVERIFHEVVTAVAKVVEWLAYLFDWDAILATQKELAGDILGALNFAAGAVRAQQQAVDRGITAFRGQIKTSLEAVKARFKTEPLGVADKRRQAAAARAPSAEEKLHWFLAKMAPQGDPAASAAGSPALGLDAPRAELQAFFDTLREAAGRIVDKDVRAAFSQAFECFVGAFTDPNAGVAFDQVIVGLLSVLEAIAGAAINVVKLVVDLLFALVDKLLGWVTAVLTAEARIPVVADLWHLITKGTPFSLLNVTTLAVAIPTTVIRKLVMHPTPVSRAGAADSSIVMLRAQVAARADDPDYGKKLASAIAYSCFALVNGVFSVLLDALAAGEMIAEPQEIELMEAQPDGRFPPMPTKPGWASLKLLRAPLFERIAWVTQAGMVVTSWPGGYPNFKHEFFPGDPAEDWGSGLWIYEAGLTVIDLVCILSPLEKKLRRAGEVQTVFASILGLGHLVLVLVVMGVELANKSDWYKAHVVPWTAVQGGLGALSEGLSFLMLPKLTVPSNGTTLFAYLVTEGAAVLADAGINLRLGIGGLIDPPTRLSA